MRELGFVNRSLALIDARIAHAADAFFIERAWIVGGFLWLARH